MSLDLDRQKATAKHLQELYAIAVGVGLFIAMTTLIDDHQQFHGSAFPLVLAYVATLIPFYRCSREYVATLHPAERAYLTGRLASGSTAGGET